MYDLLNNSTRHAQRHVQLVEQQYTLQVVLQAFFLFDECQWLACLPHTLQLAAAVSAATLVSCGTTHQSHNRQQKEHTVDKPYTYHHTHHPHITIVRPLRTGVGRRAA
jgi:hypothetical protein